VEAGQPWVRVAPARGTVDKETRVWVAVDWARAPVGTHRVPLTVTAPDGRRTVVDAVVRNPTPAARAAAGSFVEGDGYVAVEAEHFARAVAAPGVRWQVVPHLGRTLSGVTPLPTTAPGRRPGGDGPRLEYRVHLVDSGEVAVHAYLSPTLNVTAGPGLRYAVSFDDEAPQVVNLHADGSSSGRTDGNRAWERQVADNVKVLVSRHRVARPGAHVLKFWMVDAGVVLQRLVVDVGGVRPSYLGPPESHRAGAAATAGADPAASR
jgi:hypothetical protein